MTKRKKESLDLSKTDDTNSGESKLGGESAIPSSSLNEMPKSTGIEPNPKRREKTDHMNNGSGKRKYSKKAIKNTPSRSVPAGTLLEYRLKRLLFNMGYFPKVGVVMKTSQDETAVTITDLDVYGIYVHKDFTSKSIWADCKSGGARVHERISWIKGIMNTVDINDVIFVKGGVRTEVKQYARKYGIQIMDLNIVQKLENDYNIKEDDWTGSWNPATQHNQLVTLAKVAVPTNDVYKKIANFISADYWVLDNYSRIKKIITAIRELTQMLGISIPEEQLSSIKWAINELICLFLLATLNISKELYYFNEVEKRETIFGALSAGDVSNEKRREIFDAAFRVAYSMVQSQIPEYDPPAHIPPINLKPPRYSEAYYDLVIRITNNPLQYYDLLRFMDFSLMEYDLQSRDIEHEQLKIMFSNYDDLLIGAKTVLHFICEVTGIPRSHFQFLK